MTITRLISPTEHINRNSFEEIEDERYERYSYWLDNQAIEFFKGNMKAVIEYMFGNYPEEVTQIFLHLENLEGAEAERAYDTLFWGKTQEIWKKFVE